MTTDTTALQERIAEELYYDRHPEGRHRGEWPAAVYPDTVYECRDLAAAVLPVIAAEVRAAKAEALREAADLFDSSVGVQDLDNTLYFHGTPWLEASVQAAHENSGPLIDWLRARATEYETGGRA